jgi:hypothetical protein
MKKVITLLFVILFIYSCKNSNKDISKYNHPLDKPYDSSANIFKEEKYIEKNILKIIQELGPMSIRKENNIWYMYRFDHSSFVYTESRFKFFRVPFDSIYNFKSNTNEIKEHFFYINPLGEQENEYIIEYTDKLNNIYSAEGLNYDYKNDTYKDYKSTNEIKIENFGYNNEYYDSSGELRGTAVVYNTTKNSVKNIKLKISVFDEIIDGKLVSEDTFLIKDTIKKGELKIVGIIYKPHKKFKSKVITPMNIDIVNYDKL